jgi:hypothetical protein
MSMKKLTDLQQDSSALDRDLSAVSAALAHIMHSLEWRELVEALRETRELFLVGNGGNLSILSHLVSDFKRSGVQKRYVLPNEITHFSNNVRESEKDGAHIAWLQSEIALSAHPVLWVVASSACSRSLVNMLTHPASAGFKKFLMTFSHAEVSLPDVVHMNLGLPTYHMGEIALLTLGYRLLTELGGPLKAIADEANP